MSTEPVLFDCNTTGIARLILNRPAVHNAFDDALILELTALLKQCDADNNVRVVILEAMGNSFSAGADLQWMQRMANYSEAKNQQDALALAELMATLHQLSKPSIAKVQGAAFGGGVGLVACCDIAIAAERAQFCFSEVKLGLIPAVISPYAIKALGARFCQRYFLTAERFDAVVALQAGLVHEVVSSDQLAARCEALATDLCRNGPQAITAAKHLLQAYPFDASTQTCQQQLAKEIARIRISEEGQAGMQAFFDKCDPPWVS